MKRYSQAIVFLFGAGVTFFALNAPLFGFDRDNNWGGGRTILLGMGGLMLVGGLLIVFWPFIQKFFEQVQVWFDSIPLVQKYREIVQRSKVAFRNHPFIQKVYRTRLVSYFSSSIARQSALAAVFAVILVLTVYLWLVSVGTWTDWPERSDYYQQLASAFRHGQTYLLTEPDAELLALENPYDVESHLKAGHPWDVVLYNKHFYLYWGPVPALVILLLQIFFRGAIADQVLVFLFTGGNFLLLVLTLLDIRSKLFGNIGWKLVVPAVLMLGFVNPLPWILNRPQVYEAAITGGQFFMTAAILSGWHAFKGKSPNIWLLMIAGLCLSLAMGSRVSLVFAGAFLEGFLLIGVLKKSQPGGWFWAVVGCSLPFLAGLAGIGVYNYVRFGSSLEFGHRYQLTGMNLYAIYDQVISPANLFPNLHNYLLNPVMTLNVFPFVKPDWGGKYIVFPIKTPINYYTEQISGLFITSPFAMLAFVPLIMCGWKRFSLRANEKNADADTTFWLALALTGAAILAFSALIIFIVSSMRYLADFVPLTMLLSIIGWWLLVLEFEGSPGKRGLVIFAGFLLALATILMGLLLGITGYSARFETLNPALFEYLTRLFTP